MHAPYYIVLNAGSGGTDTETTQRAIADVLSAAGQAHEIMRVEDPQKLGAVARQAVANAQRYNGTVVAAGGDGTLNAVAQAAVGSGCRFGVIPQGTFNYFGRTHGISSDTAEATRALLSARLTPVQVGLVNDRVFLVNASLGLYPRSLEVREEQTRLHGRSRLVAMWAALITIIRGYRPLRVRLKRDGRSRELRTLTLFVTSNRLQLEQMGLDAGGGEDGKLTAIVLRPVSRFGLLRLFAQGAMGQLAQASGIDSFELVRLSVTPTNRRVSRLKVATDGEIAWMNAPIEFRVAPEPLLLLKPIAPMPKAAVS